MIITDFQQIPRFPHANYHITVDWSYIDETIKSFREANGVDLNPDYQRGYVWTEQQQIEFIEFSLKGGRSARNIYWNAPNWMSQGEIGIVELVDGKQRLDAIRKFMNNELKAFGTYLQDFTGKLRMYNSVMDFHVNNLSNKRDVVEWYIGMNTGGTIHTKKDLQPAYELLEKL